MDERLVRQFLDRLERLESRLLVWGVVDGGFSPDELIDLANTAIAEVDVATTADELIDALLERRLVFRLNTGISHVYRTRMAESIRLIARLRQLFDGKPWISAPTLVADYRFSLRPRGYPRRRVTASTALEQVALIVGKQSHAVAAADALLTGTDRGEPFRLADFQLRSTRRVLGALYANASSSGTVVATGTGTGKTLAFYLPVLSYLATLIESGSFWTKAVALYPRNELLKDQFAETFAEARRLDAVLRERRKRKLILGTFFGPTPFAAREDDPALAKYWKRRQAGFVCPFLSCPRTGCVGELLWKHDDLRGGIERLTCSIPSCGRQVGADELLLTRHAMRSAPPDVLFTTTETLNRNLSSSRNWEVFGINAGRRPRVVLLDEIHTYGGVSGAQVGLLMRRWRHALGWDANVHFVGLSATLVNAGQFMAELTGLNPGAVEEVGPGEDLDYASHEYLLALRGDPVSATSLLSTTIQTAMLLRRVLDPTPSVGREQSISGGLYGWRLFAFTDDLDVTNRLYHNLLDAEGRDARGNPMPGRETLAWLRRSTHPDALERMRLGQSWLICENLRFDLRQRMRIDRVSSQDPGLADGADVVVATASLEVGYNDPYVGAVIQHKAPRDMASFLQRKGRAGRKPSMRPWTIVVLSDYGRDRVAYQGYEHLFDPVLEAKSLPLSNRYVLRMQAVYALMDWMGAQILRGVPKGAVWRDLSGPPGDSSYDDTVRHRQAIELSLIERLLGNDRALRDDLAEHLRRALRITEPVVQSLMWERPRALMTSALPTILRRLKSNWSRLPVDEHNPERDLFIADHPMPDFVPRQLFSDLKLPEVEIDPENSRQGGSMPVVQAMKTLAPGKVTRRFATDRASQSHWIAPLDLSSTSQAIPVQSLCAEYDELAPCQVHDGTEIKTIRCLRPWKLRAVEVPQQVLPTSNAMLEWRTQIAPNGPGLRFEAPARSPWAKVIQGVDFHVHQHGSHTLVRRFAITSDAGIRFRDGRELTAQIRYVDGDTNDAAAVGFDEECDGLVVCIRLPVDVGLRSENTPKLRAQRSAYFRDLVLSDEALSQFANAFQRGWLCQVFLSTLISTALEDGIDLRSACEALASRSIGDAMSTVMETIFQVLPLHDDDGRVDEPSSDPSDGLVGDDAVLTAESSADADPVIRQRVHQVLDQICREPTVVQRLMELAPTLWNNPDEAMRAWMRQRFKSTLGQAILSACQSLVPQSAGGDLLLDLEPGPRPLEATATEGIDEIWITESTPGGAGVVEQILEGYADDPRRFFQMIESALAPCDSEIVDAELTHLLELASQPGTIADRMQAVRTAEGIEDLYRKHRSLIAELSAHGILVSHPVISAAQARVLRPGSSEQSDTLLLELVRRWNQQEHQLGVEIDARVFAYVVSHDVGITDRLFDIVQTTGDGANWAFNVLYGLLWPRGGAARSQSLKSYNPFGDHPEADRDVVLDVVRPSAVEVALSDPNWREQVTAALASSGLVRLTAPIGHEPALKQAAVALAAQPVEIDFLNLYPQLHGIDRYSRGVALTLRLREAVQ